MAELKNKVENALHEGRILILGGQVLLGFGFRVIFEQGFERLPEPTRYLLTASIALSIIALAFLIAPTAYHRIATDGEDTEDLHRFTSRVMMIAVAPFALGLGITLFHRFASRLILLAMVPLALGITGDLFVVVRKVSESDSFAIASACVALLLFFGLWFGYTFYRRNLRPTAQAHERT